LEVLKVLGTYGVERLVRLEAFLEILPQSECFEEQ
jgi:hypothetical protein